MIRKLELAKMMFHSLMSDMNEDTKLSFLTEIFCMTEDMRHEISHGSSNEPEMQGDEAVAVHSSLVKYTESADFGKEGSNEGDE